MSSHRAVLEMLNAKIDEVNKDLGTAISNRNAAQQNLARKEKEVSAIQYELDQLYASRNLLEVDAKLGEGQVHPS